VTGRHRRRIWRLPDVLLSLVLLAVAVAYAWGALTH
jgi:hypothetical protein